MHAGFLLGVWVFQQSDLRVRVEIFDFRKLDKVINSQAVMLEVEAGILKGLWSFDNGIV